MSEGIYGYPAWRDQLALGMTPGMADIRRFGVNPDLTAGTADVWVVGGQRVLPTTAGQVSIASTSAQDAPTGTGIRRVRVIGLDSDYRYKFEDIDLNGTTPVLSTDSDWWRVNRMFGILGGSSQSAVGTIDATLDSNIQARVTAGRGQTLQCLHTVQANTTLVVNQVFASTGRLGNGDVEIEFQVLEPAQNVWRELTDEEVYEGAIDLDNLAIVIPEKSEIRMVAITAGNNFSVSAQFTGHIYSTKYLDSLSPNRRPAGIDLNLP